jgi:hypothetical protein
MTYDESLHVAAEIAAAWPEWKRGLLGTITKQESWNDKTARLAKIADAARDNLNEMARKARLKLMEDKNVLGHASVETSE